MGPAIPVMAAVAIGSSLAAAGVSAFGAIQQGKAASQAANYQAQVAQNNKQIADQNAAAATQAGNIMEANKKSQTAALIGSERAASAGNGLDVNSGSALDLQAGAASTGALDAATIRDATARQARGYQVQGLDYQAQAGLDRMTAQNALQAGSLNAMSSILGGASSVSDKWTQYKTAGVF